ncbi:MAG: hypothetical protein QXQ43_04115 [Nitrososphaerota archaeon]
MPITATPTNNIPVVTVEEVRVFMRDLPKYNKLLDDFQFSQREVDFAIDLTVEEFNSFPPPIQKFTVDNFPSKYILLLGVVGNLLSSESILQLRNQVNSTDGDVVPLDIDNKSPQYQQLGNYYKAMFKELSLLKKQEINIESCYGRIPSGYAGVSRYMRG